MTEFLGIAVAGVVINDREILIMRRSKAKSHYSGYWDFPCERIQAGTMEQNVIRGVIEEAGLRVDVLRKGNPLTLEDGAWKYVVVPFLCLADSRKVSMDDEHDDFRWVGPSGLGGFRMIHYAPEALKTLGLV